MNEIKLKMVKNEVLKLLTDDNTIELQFVYECSNGHKFHVKEYINRYSFDLMWGLTVSNLEMEAKTYAEVHGLKLTLDEIFISDEWEKSNLTKDDIIKGDI